MSIYVYVDTIICYKIVKWPQWVFFFPCKNLFFPLWKALSNYCVIRHLDSTVSVEHAHILMSYPAKINNNELTRNFTHAQGEHANPKCNDPHPKRNEPKCKHNFNTLFLSTVSSLKYFCLYYCRKYYFRHSSSFERKSQMKTKEKSHNRRIEERPCGNLKFQNEGKRVKT